MSGVLSGARGHTCGGDGVSALSEKLSREVAARKAEIARLELELTRQKIVERDEPLWLSSAGKYMVGIVGDSRQYEVNVYRHELLQNSGWISAADLLDLHAFLTIHLDAQVSA